MSKMLIRLAGPTARYPSDSRKTSDYLFVLRKRVTDKIGRREITRAEEHLSRHFQLMAGVIVVNNRPGSSPRLVVLHFIGA